MSSTVRMTTTSSKMSSTTATTSSTTCMNPPSFTTPGSLTSRAFFGKMSSSSTSSISSSYSSLIANENLNNVPMPINPFEETNKFRLEQSVLSPNLFHVASTSTPERDTNSLWNIEQRAVLYPADIPTDESSLLAQYLYDNKITKQMNAAVEAFWTQNKVIIESPLTSSSTSTSALKTKFSLQGNQGNSGKTSSSRTYTRSKGNGYSVDSPLSLDPNSNRNSNSVNSLQKNANHGSVSSCTSESLSLANQSKARKRDQITQTVLSIPMNFDLSKIPALQAFFTIADNDSDDKENANQGQKHVESNSPGKTCQLNNSIRKKLFDQNSDDLSSTTTNSAHYDSAVMSPSTAALVAIAGGASLTRKSYHHQHQHRNSEQLKKHKPQLSNSSSSQKIRSIITNKLSKLATPGTDTDAWNDDDERALFGTDLDNDHDHDQIGSFNLDGDDDGSFIFDSNSKQRNINVNINTSQSSKSKFDNVLCDMGDDSVFLSQNGPNLSPLLATTTTPVKKKSIDDVFMDCSAVLGDPTRPGTSLDPTSNFTKNLTHQHHNRYFHFDELPGSGSNSASRGTKVDKRMDSPNLSPIRQASSASSVASGERKPTGGSGGGSGGGGGGGGGSSLKKTMTRLNESFSSNSSTSGSDCAKSIIFMDMAATSGAVNVEEKPRSSDGHHHHHHHHHHHNNQQEGKYKREEIYTKSLYHDEKNEDENENSTFQSGAKNTNLSMVNFKEQQQADIEGQADELGVEKRTSLDKKSVGEEKKKQDKTGMARSYDEQLNDQKTILLTSFNTRPMLNSINETTTNTFNQDSQDTGYQTNSGHGVNGTNSNNSSTNAGQFSTHPSYMFMDTTNYSSTTSATTNVNAITTGTNYLTRSIIDSRKVANKLTLNLNLVDSNLTLNDPKLNLNRDLIIAHVNQTSSNGTNNNNVNTITSTPMSLGDDDEFNFNYANMNELKNDYFGLMTSGRELSSYKLNVLDPVDRIINTITANRIVNNKNSPVKFLAPLDFDENLKKNSSVLGVKPNKSAGEGSKFKKSSSISMNSLDNIQPVESSTPEKLKTSNLFKLAKLNNSKSKSTTPTAASVNNRTTLDENSHPFSTNHSSTKTSLVKSKTSNSLISSTGSKHITTSSLLTKKLSSLEYDDHHNQHHHYLTSNKNSAKEFSKSTNSNKNNIISSSNSSNNNYHLSPNDKNNVLRENNFFTNHTSTNHIGVNSNKNSSTSPSLPIPMAISCEDLNKFQVDSSFMQQSILMNRISPSEYALNVIRKAKNDLNESQKYVQPKSNQQSLI